MFRRPRYLLPFAPLVLVALIAVTGGRINSVDARGRVLDDTDGSPIVGISVSVGARSTVTDADGAYFLPNLPRNARLTAQKAGYSRVTAPPDATVIRLVPLTITFEVKDEATGKGIDTPEARQPADVRVGQGSASGEMVVGPYPARDRPVIICAKDHESKEVFAKGVLMDVLLRAGGTGCPPLPASPPPAQVPSPSPSVPPKPSPTEP